MLGNGEGEGRKGERLGKEKEREEKQGRNRILGPREQKAGTRGQSGKAPSVIQLCDTHKHR